VTWDPLLVLPALSRGSQARLPLLELSTLDWRARQAVSKMRQDLNTLEEKPRERKCSSEKYSQRDTCQVEINRSQARAGEPIHEGRHSSHQDKVLETGRRLPEDSPRRDF